MALVRRQPRHNENPCIGISRGPVLDYPHTDGRAVIGGYVYRGRNSRTTWVGNIFLATTCFAWYGRWMKRPRRCKRIVFCVMPKGNGPNSGSDYTGLSSFGVDANGEIYFCQMSSIGGRIFTLSRGGPPPPSRFMPKLLSQTGIFTDMKNMTPQDFLIPYSVNMPLWSDGAVKKR